MQDDLRKKDEDFAQERQRMQAELAQQDEHVARELRNFQFSFIKKKDDLAQNNDMSQDDFCKDDVPCFLQELRNLQNAVLKKDEEIAQERKLSADTTKELNNTKVILAERDDAISKLEERTSTE